MVTSTGDGVSGRVTRGAVEREEIAGDGRRLAQICRYALPFWTGFYVSDVVLAQATGASLWRLAAYRLAGIALIGGMAAWAGRRPPKSRGGVTVLVGALGFGVTLIIGLLGAELGGHQSPYATGVAFPLAAFGLMQRQVRDSLPALAATACGYPVGLLALSPALRAELADSRAMTFFVAEGALFLALAGFAGLLSHYGWTLRRALFESRSVGRYQLTRRIGRGGMGEVWAAYHTTLKRDVAVKFLRPERTDEEAVQRFEREVRATSELAHPNTVRVLDYGVTEDGLWYFAMELLDGVTLTRLVEAEGPLEPARALHFAAQAARALAEAHARGIVHRDLKPDNLVITSAGGERDFVKVIDFGIARQLTEAGSTMTHAGQVPGTPAFMAPEVAAGGRADARADVYALGSVLYFMLVGEPPFTGESSAAIMSAQVHEPPVPPGLRMREPLPADVEAVVLRCLAKAADDRYRDGGALAEALAATCLAGGWRSHAAPPLPAPRAAAAAAAAAPTEAETAVQRPVRGA